MFQKSDEIDSFAAHLRARCVLPNVTKQDSSQRSSVFPQDDGSK